MAFPLETEARLATFNIEIAAFLLLGLIIQKFSTFTSIFSIGVNLLQHLFHVERASLENSYFLEMFKLRTGDPYLNSIRNYDINKKPFNFITE